MFPSLLHYSNFCYNSLSKLNCFCPRDLSQICGCGNLFLSHTTPHFKNSSAQRSQHTIAVLPYAACCPWREAVGNPNRAFSSLLSCHFLRKQLCSVKLSLNTLTQEKGGRRKQEGKNRFPTLVGACTTVINRSMEIAIFSQLKILKVYNMYLYIW